VGSSPLVLEVGSSRGEAVTYTSLEEVVYTINRLEEDINHLGEDINREDTNHLVGESTTINSLEEVITVAIVIQEVAAVIRVVAVASNLEAPSIDHLGKVHVMRVVVVPITF